MKPDYMKYDGRTEEPPYQTEADEASESELSGPLCCDVCGGRKVYIRGRRPGMDAREVCPTCMAETLDDIKSRLSDDYGRAYQAT